MGVWSCSVRTLICLITLILSSPSICPCRRLFFLVIQIMGILEMALKGFGATFFLVILSPSPTAGCLNWISLCLNLYQTNICTSFKDYRYHNLRSTFFKIPNHQRSKCKKWTCDDLNFVQHVRMPTYFNQPDLTVTVCLQTPCS